MYMDNLYKWLVYVGLDVLTLDGWSRRGSSSFAPTISMCHWIAGPRDVQPPRRPSLSVIRNGRAGLPGPLANDYMGRAGEVVLVAAGRANHAGYGYWKGVTGNTGAMGTEPEAADHNDWTEKQRKSYPLIKIAHLFAMWEKGLISWNQIASNRIVGHSEYALPKGRKIDINGYTMTNMRSQIAALIPGFKKRVNHKPIAVGTPAIFDRDTYTFTDGVQAPTPTTERKSWLEMATFADVQRAVAETPITVTRGGKKTTRTLETILNNLDVHVAKIDSIPDDVLDLRVPVQRGGETRNVRLGTLISGQDAAHNRFAADLAALREVVSQLATGQGVAIDYDRVEEAAKQGAAAAIEEAGGNDS